MAANETELERLIVRLIGDASSYTKMLNEAIGQARAVADDIAKATKDSASAASAGWVTAFATAGMALTQFGHTVKGVFGNAMQGALAAAGKYETTTIAFEVMMGSAKEATNILERMTKFAAETPFEMPQITQAARGLIMFGERGDQLMDTLKMLGNAAAGTSSDFGMIALIFNQIRGVGRLLTQDFRQLSTRGVLSLADLAKYFKVSQQAAQEMLNKGKISFEDVRGILKSLSAEGGRFANMMEKQAKTYEGMMSTLRDNINLTWRSIGEQLVPTAKVATDQFIKLTEVIRNMPGPVKTAAAVIIGLGSVLGSVAITIGQTLNAYAALLLVFGKDVLVKLLPLIGGLAAKFAALAVAAAPVLLISAGILAIGVAAVYVTSRLIDINKQLEKAAELNSKILERDAKERKKFESQLAATPYKETKKEMLFEELHRSQKEAKGLEVGISQIKDMMEKTKPGWFKGMGIAAYKKMGGSFEDPEIKNLELYQARLDALKPAMAAYKTQLDELIKADAGVVSQDTIDAADKYIQGLKEQIQVYKLGKEGAERQAFADKNLGDVKIKEMLALQREAEIWKEVDRKKQEYEKTTEDLVKGIEIEQATMGMLPWQVEAYKASLNAANNEQRQFIWALYQQKAALALTGDIVKLNQDLVKLNQDLGKSIATFGMTSNEVKLYELRMRGASDAQLFASKTMMDYLDALNKGKGLTEKYMTPQQKYNKAVAELNKMMSIAPVSLSVYQKAIADIRQELIDTQDKAYIEVRFGIKGNEAVRAGTKEAMELMGQTAIALGFGMQHTPVVPPAAGSFLGPGTSVAPAMTAVPQGIMMGQGPGARGPTGALPMEEKLATLLERIAVATEILSTKPAVTFSELGVS